MEDSDDVGVEDKVGVEDSDKVGVNDSDKIGVEDTDKEVGVVGDMDVSGSSDYQRLWWQKLIIIMLFHHIRL